MKVFKYSIPSLEESHFTLELPRNAQILTLQTQDDWPQIWALVNPSQPAETRNFILVETGQDIQIKDIKEAMVMKHIGTFQKNNGSYVGHIFEISTAALKD